MKRLMNSLFAIILVGSLYSQVVVMDFETGQFNQGCGLNLDYCGGKQSPTCSSSECGPGISLRIDDNSSGFPIRAGNYSCRQKMVRCQSNAMITQKGCLPTNKEIWMGLSYYIPADWTAAWGDDDIPNTSDDRGTRMMQWHDIAGQGGWCPGFNGGPGGMDLTSDGEWHVNLRRWTNNGCYDRISHVLATLDEVKGKWIDVVMNAYFTSNNESQGFFKIWLYEAGTVPDLNNPDWEYHGYTYANNNSPRWDIGMYTGTGGRVGSGQDNYNWWVDEIRWGEANDGVDFWDVAPPPYYPYLVASDDFSGNLDQWHPEIQNSGSVNIVNGKMEWSISEGMVLWFKKKLKGNVQIEYDRVIYNDKRVADMNQFWMATEADGSDVVFGRSGEFSDYDPMRLYYGGTAVWNNSRNRLRRYPRTSTIDQENTNLMPLSANTTYHYKVIHDPNGNTQLWIDNTKIFDFDDNNPYNEGLFGFRALGNHESIDNFEVWCLSGDCGSGGGGAQNQPPVAQDDAYSIEVDNTLSIVAPGVLGNDTDSDGPNALTADLVSDVSNGTLTLNTDGSFTYIPNSDFQGDDSFTYRAYDGEDYSGNATVTVTVAPCAATNVALNKTIVERSGEQSPNVAEHVIDGIDGDDGNRWSSSPMPQYFTIDLGQVYDITKTELSAYQDRAYQFEVFASETLGDIDSKRVVDATGNIQAGTAANPITNNFTKVSARYVKVVISSAAVYTGSWASVREFRVFNICEDSTNNPPVANNDSYTTDQDVTLNISAPGVLSNDTDSDGPNAVTVALGDDVTNGSLSLNSDGSFSYTPNTGYTGSDAFTYYAYDGEDSSDVATVSIDVTQVNVVPTATDDSYTTDEDVELAIAVPGVLSNDDDPDTYPNSSLEAVLVSDVANGTLSLNSDGSFTYLPGANYNGNDSFTYQAYDGQDNSNTATVSITINAVNDAPIANDDSYTVTEGQTLNVTAPGVLSNDTDVDGPALDAVLISSVSNGSLTLNSDGSFSYTPNAGFIGTDQFSYEATDGLLSDGALVTIQVNSSCVPANVALNQIATASCDDGNVPSNTVDGIDNTDDNRWSCQGYGAWLIIELDDNYLISSTEIVPYKQRGYQYTIEVSTDGSSYTQIVDQTSNSSGNTSLLADSFDEVDAKYVRFTFTGCTGSNCSGGGWVSIREVRIIGCPSTPNAVPVAMDDNYNVDEDNVLSVAASGVLLNDSDLDGPDPITAVLAGNVSNGSLSLSSDGSFTYTPNANYNGSDQFTYTAYDGRDNSTEATVTITIDPMNDAPVAIDDNYETDQDGTLNVSAPGVLLNDSDVDNPTLSPILLSDVSNGSLTLNSDGSFTYVPNAGFSGDDSFTYQATDGAANSNTATVTITVNIIGACPTFEYRGFTSGVTTNGNATLSSGRIMLTDNVDTHKGSAYHNLKVDITNFTTSFDFQVNSDDGIPADGLTFIIQNVGLNALGNHGGSLGYVGISGSQKVAVRFEFFNDPSTGLYVDESLTEISLPSGLDFDNGNVYTADINYDGTTLTVTITNNSSGLSQTNSYNVDIASQVGANTAYVGFTAGCGGRHAKQEIISWEYCEGNGAEAAPLSLGKEDFNVYPVPCSVCYLNINESWIGANIVITDLLGKVIYTSEYTQVGQAMQLDNSIKGLAVLKIEKNGKSLIKKILIE